MDTASIKLDAKACQGLFANLLSRVGDLKDVPPLVTEVQDQYGRFNLWTASMAVFAPGQACLDFRLKDVPEARDLFVKHISILTTRIEQLHEIVDEQISDSDSEDVRHDRLPKSESWALEDILHSIRHTIDWLHRLSNPVRKARFASQNERAAAFVLRDDMGTDITESLRYCFRAIIKRDYKDLNEPLVDRLTETMILRRKRILYRRSRHRRWILPDVSSTKPKLDILPVQPSRQNQDHEIPQAAGENASSREESSPKTEDGTARSTFTASVVDRETYLRPATLSQISRATSAPFQPGERLLVPPPPRESKKGSEFVCDYCCLVLSCLVALDRDKWANHVKKDLDAYICVFDNCTEPYKLYSSSKEWLAHMSSQHRTRWHCPARNHEPTSFEAREEFIAHMDEVHPGCFRAEHLGFIANSCARALAPTIPHCPFCSEPAANLDAHVRQHLHYFALQSIPWQDDSAGDNGRTSTSRSDHTSTSDELERSTLRGSFDDMPLPESSTDETESASLYETADNPTSDGFHLHTNSQDTFGDIQGPEYVLPDIRRFSRSGHDESTGSEVPRYIPEPRILWDEHVEQDNYTHLRNEWS